MKREEALDVALGQIEQQFGKGSVMRMSDRPQVRSGRCRQDLALDMALGIGGLPRGRIVEVFGPGLREDDLVYHVMAEAQRRGGICLHRRGARDGSVVCAPDRRRHRPAARLAARHRRAGTRDHRAPHPLGRLDVVAIDSVAALVPKAEIEGEMGDSHVGLQARLMSQALRTRRHAQPHGHDLPLHEPAAREDRSHVRQPGDDARRSR
jgi:recombination protein RecA